VRGRGFKQYGEYLSTGVPEYLSKQRLTIVAVMVVLPFLRYSGTLSSDRLTPAGRAPIISGVIIKQRNNAAESE
jgi:hypothetical protein